jgi:uncharacterized protein YecT (DUF1311 family)
MHIALRLAVPATLALGALALAPAARAAADEPRPITVAAGKPAHLQGGIARGETARYTFDWREDQWLEVSVGSTEGNAVVHLYGPGWSIDDEGGVVPGTSDLQVGGDAGTDRWAGLPDEPGRYLVEVGSDRGGAQYDLSHSVRAPTRDDCGELPQQPMNFCFSLLVRAAEAQRARAFTALQKAVEPERRSALASVEKAWRAFVDAQCAFEAAVYEGGSLQPTIHAGCVLDLTQARIEKLEQLLADEQER